MIELAGELLVVLPNPLFVLRLFQADSLIKDVLLRNVCLKRLVCSIALPQLGLVDEERGTISIVHSYNPTIIYIAVFDMSHIALRSSFDAHTVGANLIITDAGLSQLKTTI